MKKVPVLLLTAGFLVSGVDNSAHSAPSQKTSEQKTPDSADQPQPASRPIAIGRQRISREKQTIAISRGSQKIVANYFTELVIARIVRDFSLFARTADPQRLSGLTVSLARDAKAPDRWNIFPGGASDGEALILTENVFRIRQVLSATERDPVKIQIDGRVYHLEPGEVLFLLG